MTRPFVVMTIAYDTYAPMKAEPCQDGAHPRRGNAFWVVRDGSAPGRSFAVVLPDGREAMALFNSEDEARVFCQFGEEGANLGIRETSTAEGKSHLKVLYGYSPPLRGGRFIYCG